MATPIPVTEKYNTAAIVAVVFLMRLSESCGRVETKISQVSAGQLFLSGTTVNEFYSQNSKIHSEVELEEINENISKNRIVGVNDAAGYSVINELRRNTTLLFQSSPSFYQVYWWKQRKTINKFKSKSKIQTMTKDVKNFKIIKRVKRDPYGVEINGNPFGSISNALSTARRKSFKNARKNAHEDKATRLVFDKINSEIFSLKLISTKHSKTNFNGQNRMLDKSTSLKLITKNVTIKSDGSHKKMSRRSNHKLKTCTAKQRPKLKATNKQKTKHKTLISSTGKGHTPRNRLKSIKLMSAYTKASSTEKLPKIGATTRPFEILPGGYFKSDEKNDDYINWNSKTMRGVTPYTDKTMRNTSKTDFFKDMYIAKNQVNASEISENGEGYDDYQEILPRYNVYNDWAVGSGYYDAHFNYSYGDRNEIYNILVFNFFTTTVHIPFFCPTVPRTTVVCPPAVDPPDLIRETLLFDYNIVIAAAVTGFIVLMISLCIWMSCGTQM